MRGKNLMPLAGFDGSALCALYCAERCLALPKEAKQGSEFNASRNCLGKKHLIVFQGVSEWLPKPE
jgi:hypothetical protein